MIQDNTDGPEDLPKGGFVSGHLVDDDEGHDCLPFALSPHDTSHGLQPSPRGVYDFGSDALGASLVATSISNSISSRESATTMSIDSINRSKATCDEFDPMTKSNLFPSTAPRLHTSERNAPLGHSVDASSTNQSSLPPSPPQSEKRTTEGSKSTTQVPAEIAAGIEGGGADNSIFTQDYAKEHNVSPESSTTTASTVHMSDEFQSVIITPLFPSQEEQKPSLSGSLGFSDLMREADDAVAIERSFKLLEAVPEEVDETATQSSRQSSAATPMVTNCATSVEKMYAGNGSELLGQFLGQEAGATIVPAASDDSLDQLSSRGQRDGYEPSSAGHYYRSSGKVQASQLDKDTFSVSTHVPPPCSVRDVIDVLASPDVLRLWCVPVKTAIVTREGRGLPNEGSLGSSGESDREYDGEWVEVTTTQLISPPTCGTCVYKGVTTAMNYLGFPSHGSVKMFVERNRGQVGLTIGPFSGGAIAQHTIRVQDADAGRNGAKVGAVQTGVTVTDTVRISTEDERDGYSCGLFDLLGKCLLPSLADYMGQAALSLENLRDLVCAGETAVLASEGTSSIDFGGGGLQGDNNDGRTPLLPRY